jgi:hypothetical protein
MSTTVPQKIDVQTIPLLALPLTITRRSTLTGTVNTMTVHITNRALLQWQQGEMTLRDVDPPLTAAEKRFLETGVTPEEAAAALVVE